MSDTSPGMSDTSPGMSDTSPWNRGSALRRAARGHGRHASPQVGRESAQAPSSRVTKGTSRPARPARRSARSLPVSASSTAQRPVSMTTP